MASLNNFQIIGRLTADPEARETRTNSLSSFTVAVDRFGNGDERKADFFRCTAFDKQANFIQQYLNKGSMVYVQGRLEVDNVGEGTDRKTYVNLKVGQIQSLGAKSESNNAGYTKPAEAYANTERFGHGSKEPYGDDSDDPFAD